ncbi:MAG: helix-turn-helix transcriptional regulator [Victivallales bacterium]|nr:helix-turn-helix transcriptional regulator [Victivallales bacterium]
MKNSTKPQTELDSFRLESVGYFKGDRNIPSHAHSHAELVYVADGQCASRFGNGIHTRNCSAGLAFLIPPHLLHDQRGDVHTIFMEFALPDGAQVGNLAIIDLRNDPFVRKWLDDLLTIWITGERQESNALAQAIFLRCRRCQQQQETMPRPQSIRFHDALTFISNNFRQSLTAQDIAQHVKCSVNTLNGYFHKQLNQSMMSYLYSFRLGIASQLLQNDYLSIKEIADRCGFADMNYFIRTFKKHYGTTPGKTRKNKALAMARLDEEKRPASARTP